MKLFNPVGGELRTRPQLLLFGLLVNTSRAKTGFRAAAGGLMVLDVPGWDGQTLTIINPNTLHSTTWVLRVNKWGQMLHIGPDYS